MVGLYGFPKVSLGLFPTPLMRLENMSRALGVEIWIKRDDLCGVALGGNKVRKLEYLLCDALQQGCDTVMTTGQAQSNHAMLTAACARKLGLNPILVLKNKGITARRGNQLLNHLMDTEVRFMDADSYADIYAEMDRLSEERALKTYKIPCGGSNALGSLGYMECAREIAESGISFTHIAAACGSGGTIAGLSLGTGKYLPETKMLAVCVDTDPFAEIVGSIVNDIRQLTGETASAAEPEYINMAGPGYSVPSEEGMEAIRMMLSLEGIVLDPCYTGKAFAGILRLALEGRFKPDDRVLFVHTGGAGGLFAPDWEKE